MVVKSYLNHKFIHIDDTTRKYANIRMCAINLTFLIKKNCLTLIII